MTVSCQASVPERGGLNVVTPLIYEWAPAGSENLDITLQALTPLIPLLFDGLNEFSS